MFSCIMTVFIPTVLPWIFSLIFHLQNVLMGMWVFPGWCASIISLKLPIFCYVVGKVISIKEGCNFHYIITYRYFPLWVVKDEQTHWSWMKRMSKNCLNAIYFLLHNPAYILHENKFFFFFYFSPFNHLFPRTSFNYRHVEIIGIR